MLELVDKSDSKSDVRKNVTVRLRLLLPLIIITIIILTNNVFSRSYFETTINKLISEGYKVIKIEHITKNEYVYHLTNGKMVIVCQTGFTYTVTRCSYD